jgi:hypothetical protein
MTAKPLNLFNSRGGKKLELPQKSTKTPGFMKKGSVWGPEAMGEVTEPEGYRAVFSNGIRGNTTAGGCAENAPLI